MVVFHGSDVIVEKPELRTPNRTLDFGLGFYTTTNEEQAKSFAYNVYMRNGKIGNRYVSLYKIDYENKCNDYDCNKAT